MIRLAIIALVLVMAAEARAQVGQVYWPNLQPPPSAPPTPGAVVPGILFVANGGSVLELNNGVLWIRGGLQGAAPAPPPIVGSPGHLVTIVGGGSPLVVIVGAQ